MSRPSIEVTAASRLHFGMFSFGRTDAPQFGGMGAMIAAPGLRLRISAAETLTSSGALADRALQIVQRVKDSLAEPSRLGRGQGEGADNAGKFRVEVISAPREHAGFGVGTQLALSVVAGVRRFLGLHDLTPHELAEATGRGLRSAVGTYGFFQGGWIVESGKQSTDKLSPLLKRLEVPATWRFVLMIPKQSQGLHGPSERKAFADLPPVPAEMTDRLTRLAMDEVIPALEAADFDAVSEGLYRFNHDAGLCFAPRQHGAYANEATATLVEQLRSWGVAGIGQSSWGPAVFALQRDEPSATDLIARLKLENSISNCDFLLAPPANTGAQITPLH
jgi:beta-ribofuranosylaminobenzene 5'-phosphate synthase